MNKQPIVNLLARVLDGDALGILRAVPGVTAELGEPGNADALLTYAGCEQHIAVQFRKRVNAATAYQLIHGPGRDRSLPLLVIAGAATQDARGLLEDNDIGLVDGHGYAHVELPGLLLHYEGSRTPAAVAPARLRGKAGVAAQALLLDLGRTWRVNELAETANISAGLAHRVLARLEEEHVVEVHGKGPQRTRTVAAPGALLDLWAEEELAQTRVITAGYLLAQTPAQLIERVSTSLSAAGITHAITGAAAASLIAPFVTAVPFTEVWVPSAVATTDLLDAVGATATREGHNVTFLTMSDDTGLAFATDHEGVRLANPIRIYGDLRRDRRRGAEQAQRLREEILKL